MSTCTFDTLDSGYTMPVHDNAYHIKHGLPFGNEARSKKDKSYMKLIEEKSISIPASTKYTK